jgi:type IV pilus assembly protein PilY1
MTGTPLLPATAISTKLRGWLLAALSLFCATAALGATTNLADEPLFASAGVPGNLALTPSVEYPTAISVANIGNYSGSMEYLGYFDPGKCYVYRYDSASPASSHFEPNGPAKKHECSGKWSGNFLNWATMQTIDPFRWALTGGYRAVDTPTTTILEKAWGANQGGNGIFPNRGTSGLDNAITGHRLAASLIPKVTPLPWGTFNLRIWACGTKMVFSSAAVNTCNGTDWSNQTATDTTYQLYVRVRVCMSGSSGGGLESNCKAYGSNFKPEGLLQQYAMKIRYSAFGYLNDGDIKRDGGVLRARMKFVGPERPVPGSQNATNANQEWDANTGVFITNPDSTDAGASSVTNSGVLNYLNKFGQESQVFKMFDPVGEMYYAATRYFRNLGNVSAYTSGAQSNATFKDGFPVIERWSDPILYACQRNFILGIGDVNTHADANLPGATSWPPRSWNEPATPSEVSSDTTVDAVAATNKVGQLEGLGNLGNANTPWCCNANTYLMAGLAYDAHTKDIRPDLGGKQTISTYWVDVLENQIYRGNNQYYLAAKYGGFDVPGNFGDPYARTTALPQSWWTTGEMNPNTGHGTNMRPKNYFPASRADLMIGGLRDAFARIASEVNAFTTSFSTALPQVSTTGNASYSAQYDAETWIGEVTASELSFAANGDPSLQERWKATEKLATQLAAAGWDTGRRVVTWNPSAGNAGSGVPFRYSELSASQRTALDTAYRTGDDGADYLSYLRGDRTNETSGVYRKRTKLLGDIVGSKVVSVGRPSMPLTDAPNPGYPAFRSSWANRQPMIYVGSNDGMLHAFNGALTGDAAGVEVFAFVPNALFQGPNGTPQVDGLASLGNPTFEHHFFVNATPKVFDVDLNRTPGASGAPNWKSILIGGLGKGGRSYYAIDVTDPAGMTSEAAVASRVLWEFTDPDLGYSYGEPLVVKTRKYGWVVILASGYNNPDGRGYLFFVNPRTGALLEKVSTGVGTSSDPSGFAHPMAYVLDFTDGTADAVYGGDLFGNVWRFDLTTATGRYAAPTRFAELKTASGSIQPVTTRPLVEVDPRTNRRYVFTGTGRLLADSDISSTQEQTFYAIVDGSGSKFNSASELPQGVRFPIGRSRLLNNTNLLDGVSSSGSAPMGWYVDLGTGANGIGWRVINDSTAFFGVVAFASTLPNGDACSPSGSSRIYALDFVGGKSMLTNAAGSPIAYSVKQGVTNDLRFFSVDGKVKLVSGGDRGGVQLEPGNFGAATGFRRLNWRELPVAN